MSNILLSSVNFIFYQQKNFETTVSLSIILSYQFLCLLNFFQGNAAFKGRQWNKAVNYYTEAIKLNMMSATYYSNRAAAYLELGCFQQAEEDCSKAISLDKKNVKAYLRRGTARESLLCYKDAAQDFKHALVLEPQNKVANLAEKRLRKLMT